jgi:hypothetical protein
MNDSIDLFETRRHVPRFEEHVADYDLASEATRRGIPSRLNARMAMGPTKGSTSSFYRVNLPARAPDPYVRPRRILARPVERPLCFRRRHCDRSGRDRRSDRLHSNAKGANGRPRRSDALGRALAKNESFELWRRPRGLQRERSLGRRSPRELSVRARTT